MCSPLRQLKTQDRKKVLLVPGVFCADANTMQALSDQVAPQENELTLHWLPGLGGQPLNLFGQETAAEPSLGLYGVSQLADLFDFHRDSIARLEEPRWLSRNSHAVWGTGQNDGSR